MPSTKIFLQIMRRRLRQVGVAVLPGAPSMIHAPGIASQITGAVRREDLQIRMALEHAVEDEVMQCKSRLQRISDHVVEIEA